MDIELVPREHIHSKLARPDARSLTNCVHELARNLPSEIAPSVRDAGERLAHAFMELEALLIEINPLFVYPAGWWVAGDAKIVMDDNALPRQKALESLVESRAAAYPDVARKHEHGFDYVVVDPQGEIGLLTTGAGLSMMLIDELRAAGLKPYNFLDIRTGGFRGETRRLTQVLKWIGEGQKVRVLLVNIFAGITDLGEFSRLLVEAIAAAPQLKVPVVARLVGNGLHQRQVILGEMVDLRVDDGEDTDDALARQQGDANGRARIAITAGYGPPQPARIVAGVAHQRRLTAFHDPAGQAPLVGIGQLFGRVIVDLTAERQGAFLHRPAFVEDQDAPAGGPDRLQRQLQDVLQQTPQIELRRQLPADVVEEFQR